MTDIAHGSVTVPAPRPTSDLLQPFLGASLNAPRPGTAGLVRKRGLDLVVGSLLALVTAPIIIAFAVVSGLTLRCNPFFVQWRHGTGAKVIRMVKLRTLPKDFPAYATKTQLETAKVPRFGLWLRRHHLDELPQLFEVITGRMSLVGPRPRMCGGVEPIDAGYDRARRQVRQGCTGLWQISIASEGVATGVPEYDLFYLRHMSLRLDLWIIGRTVLYLVGLAAPIGLADIPRWTLRRASAPAGRHAATTSAVAATDSAG
jgi:lipopolysaccharide/colanic/teichoic acid biosynthesis glycosyltransferase